VNSAGSVVHTYERAIFAMALISIASAFGTSAAQTVAAPSSVASSYLTSRVTAGEACKEGLLAIDADGRLMRCESATFRPISSANAPISPGGKVPIEQSDRTEARTPVLTIILAIIGAAMGGIVGLVTYYLVRSKSSRKMPRAANLRR
jgi:hypothetical protein